MDGLAVPVNVVGRGQFLRRPLRRSPQPRCPLSERVGQRLGSARPYDGGQEALGVPVAVGPSPAGEQRERIAGVSPQVPGALEADRRQEQQGQEQSPPAIGVVVPAPGVIGGQILR